MPLFLGPGLRLAARWNRLVETVKTRKKRGKTGEKWARYGLKRVSVEVWDFALPAAHSLPTIWGWDDHRYEEFYCVTRTPIFEICLANVPSIH